ncbi:class I SAM-dependent methyltransferase [Rhodovulum sp. DZ06]|uniref:class I SAM-dependent methyltransferase n=1 Tax=Rhodovulum sp. DZ06 TaxID=3425126 RepID=UPI003D334AF5
MATKDQWAGALGARWAQHVDAQERMMAAPGRETMDALGPLDGARILDMGCGGGATTLELAHRAGPVGTATGLDVSTDVLAAARARRADAAARGEAPAAAVEFIHGDAAQWTAPAPFDALYSRCGAMFFDDQRAAYAHIRAQMAPGGRMALFAWGRREACAWGWLPRKALGELLPPAPQAEEAAPGPFRWGEIEPVLEMLAAAGWQDPAARKIAPLTPLSHGDDPDPLARGIAHCFALGPASGPLGEADEATRAAARDRLAEALAPYVKDGAVQLPAEAWIVTARA